MTHYWHCHQVRSQSCLIAKKMFDLENGRLFFMDIVNNCTSYNGEYLSCQRFRFMTNQKETIHCLCIENRIEFVNWLLVVYKTWKAFSKYELRAFVECFWHIWGLLLLQTSWSSYKTILTHVYLVGILREGTAACLQKCDCYCFCGSNIIIAYR